MKTSHKIASIFILLTTIISTGQEKLKGNREVTTEKRTISEFNRIEVIDNLNVELVYSDEQNLSVRTDSNLQSSILTDVDNGILTIKTSSKIKRKKELTVIVSINNSLNEIYAYNNAKVFSDNLLKIDSLTINAFDNSDFDLKLSSNTVEINAKKTSDLKIDALCTSLIVKCEENGSLKGNFNCENTIVEIIDRSAFNAVGNSENITIESKGNSTFKGRDFDVKTADIKAYNNSNIYVNSKESLIISAYNNSEVFIYSNPKITINEFFDRASLHKKDLDKKLF